MFHSPSGFDQSHCRRNPVSGALGPHLSSPSSAEGPGLRAVMPLTWYSTVQQPVQSLFPSASNWCYNLACVAAEGREHQCLKPLISFDYISLLLEERKLSFNLSNPFLDLLRAMLVLLLIQTLSWILQGFVPMCYTTLFPDFSQVCIFPFMVTIWLPLCMSQLRNFFPSGEIEKPSSLPTWELGISASWACL